MELVVETGRGIEWGVTGTGRIAQNIVNLINTRIYDIAYDRTLGIRGDFIDMPLQKAIVKAQEEIYRVIMQKEPRVKEVSVVEFTGMDQEGNMQFRVVVQIG